MNQQAMLQKLRKIQREIQEAQEKIEESEYEGKATGVTALVQGNKTIIEVKISDELLEDKEILQDSIVAAINSALLKIENDTNQLNEKFSGMGLPSGFGF
ncbi:MAG: YbaB/EbfC family nucleoid-associated protein [Acholeplasmatales bacterium]|jgi:DNA-binding YbaB/EbfC family protein|nr:YbaB/EbfC family nucleoid-associated protein [Acholeplasmatales bacterium]